jgi:hypothetical protein
MTTVERRFGRGVTAAAGATTSLVAREHRTVCLRDHEGDEDPSAASGFPMTSSPRWGKDPTGPEPGVALAAGGRLKPAVARAHRAAGRPAPQT